MNRIKDIILELLFVGLLVVTGFMQTSLKENPQIFMIIFGGFTLISFFMKQNIVSTILFFILVGTMLCIFYFLLTNWIIDIIEPNRGWVMIDGVRRRVMDMSWFWGVFVGFIFSPLTVLFYHKMIKRNDWMERIVTITFTLTTIIIFILYEL